MGRLIYAAEMYAYCLKTYSLTLDQAQFDKMCKKVTDITDLYKDPITTLGNLANKMSEVETMLAKADSGKSTQQKEKEIVDILADVIKTAEEKQQQQQQQQQQKNNQGQGQGPKQEEKEGDKQGDKPGDKDGKKSDKPPQSTPDHVTNPASKSGVVPGEVQRPVKGQAIYNADNQNPDWSDLPPRERQRLQEIAKKAIAERYRQIISDYHSEIAKPSTGTNP